MSFISHQIMNENVVFTFRSPMSSRPYYYSPHRSQIDWTVTSSETRMIPPDGFFVAPPPKPYENNFKAHQSHFFSEIRTVRRIPTISTFSLSPTNDSIPILQLTGIGNKSFFKIPYLPFDLLIHEPSEKILDFLKNNVNKSSAGKKKDKTKTIDLITPEKNSINSPLFINTPTSASPISISLFKSIKKFKKNENPHHVEQMIRLIDGNKQILIPECAFQLITETNNISNNSLTIRAWKLMMIFVGRYEIPEPFKTILRSYFIIASSHEEVYREIREISTICLIRITSENLLPFQYTPGTPAGTYIECCTSLTQIFGVSLSEILAKEDIRSGSRRNKDDPLVPQILRKLVGKMLELNAPKIEGIFRIPGDNAQEVAMAQQINSGDWEVSLSFIHTVASLTKKFVRELQDPLIPSRVLDELSENDPPSKVIKLINGLPNSNRDTLMYFFGFLQQIAENESVNKMTASNIIISIGPMFVRTAAVTSLNDIKSATTKRDFVLQSMINNWNTSQMYKY
ncbi:RhoGAP domain containing protein [Tritrichomonas foetus]|uniref:RhoGAP domain containing protein n=1 Tax=Tritrichomonas foetus TaxID=1144522 RepID=A0A1J4JCE2_9EUKA|nr:RhoGAP domain containing protein [Tritrichomonas foetus]|eukprot:OHS96808.1 RhoGAP domain containing protein [Tritrichomonas foetus]